MASSTSSLIFIALFTILHSSLSAPSYMNKDMHEAEIVALETSGFIVPVTPLVQKIMRDLKSIRTHYKQVQDTTIKSKWVPGQVLVRGQVTDEQIHQIDTSVYGPLKDVKKYPFGYLLTFSKAYHPEVLSERLHQKYKVMAEPNTSTGSAGNAVITYKPKDGMYTIEKGPAGFNYPGYSNKYVWTFQVRQDGDVQLRSMSSPGVKL